MRRRRSGHGDDRRALELSALTDVTAVELDALLGREQRLVLVDFWTPRCEPCRELRPQLEALAAHHADVCVIAVDADAEPAAATRHRVGQFPTLVFFKRGRELHRLKGGALPASTLRLLDER
ncbi:MAG TPA: thioredoxin family protein [Candidatus Dormibacteraeota bacterium]|nr:thioredoxin family protein [Candidatus Dormibacteraeota bacterium]